MEFIDLKSQYKAYKDEFDPAIAQVISDAAFIGGAEVNAFEEELASYIGVEHCITCGNGTEALQLIYMAYGIGSGDAVFCPDMTFIASIEPAAMLGATPVFVDIDPVSYNLDPAALEKRICEVKEAGKLVPKAVVAVDFLGNPAAYDELSAICKKHGLLLIEDGAQGTGGIYKGRKLGSLGDIAATSFFPSKPLGCYGDGGAVFTNDEGIAELIRSIKVHGKGSSKYDNVRIGMNSRLDNLQAAVLRVKLAHLDEEMERRQEVAKAYDAALRDVISVPFVEPDCRSAYAQYILLAKDSAEREMVMAAMNDASVPSLIYYPKCLHAMKAFKACNDESYPVAEDYAARNFGLPFSAFLCEEDIERVCSVVCNAID